MQNARPLFETLLGTDFGALPAELRAVHEGRLLKQLRGRCSVERGTNWLSRPIAWIASLPPAAADIPLTVTMERLAEHETWKRDFNGHRMDSRLWRHGHLLAERLGPLTMYFALTSDQGRIQWRVEAVRYLGVPLPAAWFSNTQAMEQVREGRYAFDVRASLPLLGLLVHYRGWLSEDA